MSTADIAVGDKVHVEFTVEKIDEDLLTLKREHFYCSNGVEHRLNVGSKALVKHIPKPRELKAGGEVRINNGYYKGDLATVLAVNGAQAWIKLIDRKGETLVDPITWLEPL